MLSRGDDAWRSVAALTKPWAPHTLLALTDDTALYLACPRPTHGQGIIASSDVTQIATFFYDANGDRWDDGPVLEQRPFGWTATLLLDKSILLVGGHTGTGPVARVDRFDTVARTWRRGADLPTSSTEHVATLLQDGRVLVVGSNRGSQGHETYLYDPSRNTWTTSKTLVGKRRDSLTLTRLSDGRIAVFGGWLDSRNSTIDVFDPGNEQWAREGALLEVRMGAQAALLADHRVLVCGGLYPNPDVDRVGGLTLLSRASTEIWDPHTGITVQGPSLRQPRSGHFVLSWPSGHLLVVGGRDNTFGSGITAEVLEMASDVAADS